MNNPHTHLQQNSQAQKVKRRYQQQQRNTPVRGVVQDKPRSPTAPIASIQPDPIDPPHRAIPLNTKRDRSQNLFASKFKAVKTTSWQNPLVKTELDRTAKLWGVSLSKVIAIACE